jgi:integrase
VLPSCPLAHTPDVVPADAHFPPLRERREPTLIQKRPGRWTARYRHAGRTKDVSLGLTTRPAESAEAAPKAVRDRFRADFVLPYLRGDYSPWARDAGGEADGLLTVEEAKEAFLARYAPGRTRQTYEGHLRRFDATLAPHTLLREVTPEDVRAYVYRDGVAPSTRAATWRHLRRFFAAMAEAGAVAASPVDVVPRPRKDRTARAFVLPGALLPVLSKADEFEDPAVSGALRIALGTGLRRGELAALQAADVDLQAGTVTVRRKTEAAHGLSFRPKSRADRRVTLSRFARGELEAALSRAGGSPRAFLCSPDPAYPVNPSRLTHALSDARDLSGGPAGLTLHGLRGHFITYALLLGWPVPLVQAQAGHADSQTTLSYWRDSASLLDRRGLKRFRKQAEALGFEPYE